MAGFDSHLTLVSLFVCIGYSVLLKNKIEAKWALEIIQRNIIRRFMEFMIQLASTASVSINAIRLNCCL